MRFKSSFTTPAVAAISFCLIGGTSTAPAYADLGDQLAKLLPDDGASGDGFGVSVSMSGATAIVGAYLDDDNGTGSGSAYLFDTTTGQQLFKLLATDGAANDWLSKVMAIMTRQRMRRALVMDGEALAASSASATWSSTTSMRSCAPNRSFTITSPGPAAITRRSAVNLRWAAIQVDQWRRRFRPARPDAGWARRP